MKKSSILVLVPLVAVLTLGTMNVVRKAEWRDVTDGVTWKAAESGLRAIRVDPDSEAFLRAGIRKGDVLTAINKVPVRTKSDVLKSLWQAAATDQSVTYEINKEGMQIYPTFYPQRKAVNPIYYYLVLVGVMTLAIGLIVFFNSRGLLSLPYVFFYLLALAFAAFMIFSPTGEMTPLDMVFYGLDKLGFLAFPPLLLHFFMIFPLRKRFLKNHPNVVLAPLRAGRASPPRSRPDAHPLPRPVERSGLLRAQDGLERLELLHFAVFALVTLAILAHSTRRAPNVLVKKQLRIIVYGLGFGVLPSTVFYIVPFIAGEPAVHGRRADGPAPGPHPPRLLLFHLALPAGRYRGLPQEGGDPDLLLLRHRLPLFRRQLPDPALLGEQAQRHRPRHPGHRSRRDAVHASQEDVPGPARPGHL